MQKRRERIEQWRSQRQKGEDKPSMVIMPPSKVWKLDEESDEDEPTTTANDEDDEIDPLDAYMAVSATVDDQTFQ